MSAKLAFIWINIFQHSWGSASLPNPYLYCTVAGHYLFIRNVFVIPIILIIILIIIFIFIPIRR